MRRILTTVGLTTLLLALLLPKADALTVQIQVGPDNIKTLPYTFVFTRRDRDGLVQLGITVAPKKGTLSPGLLARVHLMDDKRRIATFPLEETRENGKVTYWLQIAPSLLEQARFEFDVLSGKEEKLPNGKTRFIALPGTVEYQFNIRDYVAKKAVSASFFGYALSQLPSGVYPLTRSLAP